MLQFQNGCPVKVEPSLLNHAEACEAERDSNRDSEGLATNRSFLGRACLVVQRWASEGMLAIAALAEALALRK
jgi:hypothetical protein